MSEQDAAPPPKSVARKAALRRLGWLGVIVLGLGTPVLARVAWEGSAEIELADAARQDGDFDGEVEHLGRAARWRLPILGHDEDAIDRLVALGEEQEARGPESTQDALAAYREARRALLSTRSWGIPSADIFDHVNERIARLMADQEERFGTDLSGDGDAYNHHLELLQDVPGPDPILANTAAVAFLGWLIASVGFVLRALDARGRLRARAAVRWGGAWVFLLVAWLVLLRYA